MTSVRVYGSLPDEVLEALSADFDLEPSDGAEPVVVVLDLSADVAVGEALDSALGPDRQHQPAVVALLGTPDADRRLKLLQEGVDEVLDESFTPQELALRVRRLADLADLRQRLARAEAGMTQATRQLQRFTYTASHDLKEPLRAIAGFSRLLEERHGDSLNETAKSYLGFILEGAERLGHMINDLLDYSRASQRELDPTDVDVAALVKEVLAELQPASDAHVTVAALPTVRTDRVLLRQVLGALLSNALKFADPERPLSVGVSSASEGPGWRLTIRDTGVGIAEEDHARIFDMFSRLHTRDEYPGTGIGLALAAMIAQRLGSQVELTSEKGVGTAVSLYLDGLRPHP